MTKSQATSTDRHVYSRNSLEPYHLTSLFFHHLPKDFKAVTITSPLPAFTAEFDLLTTMDSETRHKITHLPLFKFWSRFLKFKTLFLGTTVSEFTPLPQELDFDKAANALIAKAKDNYPLVIVKDLPLDNPLSSHEDSQFSQEFLTALTHHGFIKVEGQALAFVKIDFTSIDDYLNRFSKSRRKDFRRKLRHRDDLIITCLEAGDPIFFDEETIDLYYSLYMQVYAQSEVHFDLLSRAFFAALLQDKDPSLRVFTYKAKNGKLIGYNICFIHDNKLIDKYIGFDYPAASDYNLYFISWFINLDYALHHGLDFYVAGWTDPKVKAQLGAKFAMTKHAVYIKNPILRRILHHFRAHFESDASILAEQQKNAPHDKQNGVQI